MFENEHDAEDRATILGVLGRLGLLSPEVFSAAATDPDASLRRRAYEEAARTGLPVLREHCRATASRETDPDPVAVTFLGVLADPVDLTALHDLFGNEALRPSVVHALGAMGRVGTVPFLIDAMSDDTCALEATAAYRRITGADDVEGEKPFPYPEVAEGEDEEEALPPDPDKARRDWGHRSASMTAEVRWQGGHPVPDDQMPPAFNEMTLEARHDIYLQLRSRFGARGTDLELEARARLQSRPL